MMVNLLPYFLVPALTFAARAIAAVKGGEKELWAVELLSTDDAVARSVAADLGMVVTGRVFNNVFLMRGGGYNSVQRGPSKEWLRHHLVVWSERQVGRRRSSRREIEPARTDTEDVNRERGGDDTVWAEQFSGRFMRDVGGLNKERPKSPWDLLVSKDPLRWRQWYLEAGGGMHLNVTGLWEAGIKGGGVSVAVLDDGVELTHLDLALNYDPAASWDLLDADPDPTPVPWSRHGTQMAGIIAATHNNGLCGMGVAPWSGVGAVRMLGYLVWDAIEAKALGYEREHVDVYVAAWGPVDTGTVIEGPGVLAARALAEGIVLGRGGRGSIYIWASGNGGFVGDDCNADGYSNSVYTLTVSGSTRGGHPPEYAETCAATFVSTYSGDADQEKDEEEKEEEEKEEEEDNDEQVSGIVTTDTGGVCTESFRGSSVSAAMVAGVCALAIDMNPELTWRDMQHLMLRAATPHNPQPSQWNTNGVGVKFSHYFGFGSLDAGKMVGLARDWKTVPPAFQCRLHASLHDLPLVSSQRLVLPLSVRGCQVVQTEHVQVNLSVSARTRGQVEVVLESPMGTKSTLLPQRPLDLSPYGIYNHPLMTVHMWGEDPQGTWKLHFMYHGDGVLEPFGGKRFVNLTNTLHNWTLTIHGTEVAIGQATPHHYYYNASQLVSLKHKGTDNITQLEDIKLENPTEKVQEVTVETQYWNSPALSGGKILSYLFCFVRGAVDSAFSSVTWQKSDGTPVENVVRRLNGRDALAGRYPSMLVVREVEIPDGNFTCRVRYSGQTLTRITEVRGQQHSVPEMTEVTRVSVLGGMVVLPCPGLVPILRPTWVFQGRRLRSSRRVMVGEQEVIIRGVTEDDYGVYRCQVRSARLHYAHTTVVTLLPARGPTTLIAHYALTAYPEPPPTKIPLCNQSSSKADQNETIIAEEAENNTNCPAPYEMVQGHCVLVAPGEPRSWLKARSQCQRFNGDLLVVENAALLLALMRLFHSQGLANSSFWVGGGRHGGEWRWVSGAHVTPGGSLWYPTPNGGPEELPARHHRMFTHARGSVGPQRGKVSRSRQSKKKTRFRREETLSHLLSTRPQGIPSSSQREDGIPPHASRDSREHPRLFQSFVDERRAALTSAPEVHHASGPDTPSGHPRGPEVARRKATGRRQDEMPSRRASQNQRNRTRVPADRGSDHENLPADAPSSSAKSRFKATCLRARLRHFLSSCWSGTRLRALCQYREGVSPAEKRDPS